MLLGGASQGYAQNVGIGTNTPNASAKLDIVDANRGILIPRVALTATNAASPIASPATSLLVYNTATAGTAPYSVAPGFYYWNGSGWVRVAAGTAGWELLGNAGTAAATNFIGTTDAVDFVTRTNNTERMRVTSAGNVGINTTSPITSLHVVGDAFLGSSGVVSTTYPMAGARLSFGGGAGVNSDDIFIQRYYNSSDYATLRVSIGDNNAGDDKFEIGNGAWTPWFTVVNTGNVGIGNTAPAEKLHVVGNVRTSSLAGTGTRIVGADANGTLTNIAAGTNGQVLTMVAGAPAWSSNPTWTTTGNSGTTAASNFIGTADAIDFVTRTNNVERMRVMAGGNVGIGTTTPAMRLTVNGGRVEIGNAGDNIIYSRNDGQSIHHEMIGTYMGWDQRAIYLGGYNVNNVSGTYAGANKVYCGGSFGTLPIYATGFNTTSSRRYKQNIVPVAYGLSAIMRLRPVQYQYNFEKSGVTHVGLIAEEVDEVVPEVVIKHNDQDEQTTTGKAMGINYQELVPVLIKGMQEQQAVIEQQQKQLDALQKQVDALLKKN